MTTENGYKRSSLLFLQPFPRHDILVISITICWERSRYYYNASGQMDLSDRIAIETGICIGESFKKIAKGLRRHPSTIAHEVKENRTFIKGNYPNGKDCRMARQCTVRNLCGCDEEACNTKCRLCRGVDCTKVCDRYVSVACHKFDSPPDRKSVV